MNKSDNKQEDNPISRSLDFFYRFIKSNYTRSELADLLHTSEIIISRKISLNRWMLSEIVTVFKHKGYSFEYSIDNPYPSICSSQSINTIHFINARGGEAYGEGVEVIKNFINYYGIKSKAIEEMGMTSNLFRAFNSKNKEEKPDIKWSSLMNFVIRSGSDLYLDYQYVSPAPKCNRNRIFEYMTSLKQIDLNPEELKA